MEFMDHIRHTTFSSCNSFLDKRLWGLLFLSHLEESFQIRTVGVISIFVIHNAFSNVAIYDLSKMYQIGSDFGLDVSNPMPIFCNIVRILCLKKFINFL